jgi:hypothetical protein
MTRKETIVEKQQKKNWIYITAILTLLGIFCAGYLLGSHYGYTSGYSIGLSDRQSVFVDGFNKGQEFGRDWIIFSNYGGYNIYQEKSNPNHYKSINSYGDITWDYTYPNYTKSYSYVKLS